MEIQTQHNLIRQLKYFQLVQSNSEYMTIVRRLINQESGKNLNLASNYLQSNTQVRIDYEQFIQCFIQVAYLIYTSKYYGLNPLIQQKDVRIEERIQQSLIWGTQKKFSIVIFYSFSDSPIDAITYPRIVKHIYKYLIELLDIYNANVKSNQLDTQYNSQIDNFKRQVEIIEQKLNQIDINEKEKQFFFYLEETDLFRQKSTLLKIKNSSILDYIKTKVGKFKQSKENDVRMVDQYNNQKNKLKCDLLQLRKKEKLIGINILSFFEAIQQSNKSKFRIKIQPDQNSKIKFVLISYQLPEQPFLARLNKVNKSQDNSMQQQIPKDKVPYTEYQIQYNSQRNSICVRLVLSSIVSSAQSPDFIMFQSNVLTFDSANISLQFVDDKATDKNRSSGKNLAFRGSSCFNKKQPILQKILVLMDLTMITAKIYEPEILSIRKNFMIDKDVHRLTTMYQKVNHYTKVFLRCAKKVYNQ